VASDLQRGYRTPFQNGRLRNALRSFTTVLDRSASVLRRGGFHADERCWFARPSEGITPPYDRILTLTEVRAKTCQISLSKNSSLPAKRDWTTFYGKRPARCSAPLPAGRILPPARIGSEQRTKAVALCWPRFENSSAPPDIHRRDSHRPPLACFLLHRNGVLCYKTT
jgi:hypothetical protein